MLLDWFTIGAQALNFLILVWLMKRFLYKPILNAIDAREKLIAKELADADAKKSEAKKERDEFQKKNEEFDQQRAALLIKATDEAKAERLRLIEEARKAADALSAKRQESLINDAHNLNQAISRLTEKEVFAITRKALTDLATTSLEERMGEVFTRRLRELEVSAKNTLGDALRKNGEPALVRSNFDLPAGQRAAIQNALNETFSAEIHLRFETSPDLVSGIELSTNGQKVGWSIADYLASLEKGIDELLKAKDKPAPKPGINVEPKSERPKPDAKPEPKPEVKAESKPEPASESKVEAKAGSTPKAESDPKPEIKPEAKSEVKVAPKPEANPKTTSEANAEPKQQVKVEPKTDAPNPKEKPAPKPEVKAEPKPESASQSKTEAKPGSKPKTDSGAKTEIKFEPESGPLAKAPSALTPQMFKRVHELYEELGRADVQAVQAWEKAERESLEREEKSNTDAKLKVETAPTPEAKIESKPGTKVESKPEPKSAPASEAAQPATQSA